MAGLTPDTPAPTRIVVHRKSRELEIAFSDGTETRLSFEFLRVHSPSAEVRGHGPGQETLQTGKRDVDILAVDPVGHYAIQPRFSDGHESGIFSWDWLYRFAHEHDRLWQEYLNRLAAAGASRDPEPLGRDALAAARSGAVPIVQVSGRSPCQSGAPAAGQVAAQVAAQPAERSASQPAPGATGEPVPLRAVSIQRPRNGGSEQA
jgi:DUF971 family protein